MEKASQIEFDVDYYKLQVLKEIFQKRKHSTLALRIHVLSGISQRAGSLTQKSTPEQPSLQNYKYVKRVFCTAQALFDLLIPEFKTILVQGSSYPLPKPELLILNDFTKEYQSVLLAIKDVKDALITFLLKQDSRNPEL